METCRRIEGLVEFIAERYADAAEIGIGHFPDVAFALSNRGVNIFATDIRPFNHKGIKVIVDDITMPDLYLYSGLDLIYSMRPPLEMVPYMVRLAKTISADLIVKPLSSEYIDGWRSIRNENTTFFLMMSKKNEQGKNISQSISCHSEIISGSHKAII